MIDIKFEDYHNLVCKLVRQFAPMIPKGGVRDSEEYAEACLAFTRCRRDYNPEMKFAFSTYLSRSVFNAIVRVFSMRRKRAHVWRQPSKDFMRTDDRFRKYDYSFIRECEVKCLHEQLQVLSERDREVLYATIDGETQVSVAARMGLSAARIGQIKLRAINRARILLKRNYAPGI